MQTFPAFRIHSRDGHIVAGLEQMTQAQLTPGEVLIRARYSTINYKDALAATGAGRILRRYPLNGGIDVSGEVQSSTDPRFEPGQPVLVTGAGLGERIDGGFAHYVHAPADAVIPLPAGLSLADAMAIGTAGFTAALGIHRMEQNGQRPDGGPIAVTGATGGVGSLAVDMLAARGYRVAAISGKSGAGDYLRGIGAGEVLRRQDLDLGSKPLESIRFGGAIDNVGGELLAGLTRTMDFWGNIACIGLAASPKLETTLMPLILRGVSLLGINSTETPRALRLAVWSRLATDLRPRHLDAIVTRRLRLSALSREVFHDFIEGRIIGRTLVEID
jgi:NADPH2:quinone reductase